MWKSHRIEGPIFRPRQVYHTAIMDADVCLTLFLPALSRICGDRLYFHEFTYLFAPSPKNIYFLCASATLLSSRALSIHNFCFILQICRSSSSLHFYNAIQTEWQRVEPLCCRRCSPISGREHHPPQGRRMETSGPLPHTFNRGV